MEENMKSCMDCENAIWCDTWCEFKCTVKVRRIYEPENEAYGCRDFKKDRRKEEVKCQCKHCLSKAGDNE